MNLRTYLMIKMAEGELATPEARAYFRQRIADARLDPALKKEMLAAYKANPAKYMNDLYMREGPGGELARLAKLSDKVRGQSDADLAYWGKNGFKGRPYGGAEGSRGIAKSLVQKGLYSTEADALKDLNSREALSYATGKYRGLKADTAKNLEQLGKNWGTYGGGAIGGLGGYALADLAARAGGMDDDGSWAGTGLRAAGGLGGAAIGAGLGRSFGPAQALKFLPK